MFNYIFPFLKEKNNNNKKKNKALFLLRFGANTKYPVIYSCARHYQKLEKRRFVPLQQKET